jgi:hypothetical protein
MKVFHLAGALALLATLGTQGHAQSANTRDQVRSELAEAIRSGDILAPGDSGLTMRELHPERYPAAAVTTGKTRDQVRSEFAEAVRNGDVFAGGDSGLTLREQNPQRYPAPIEVAGKTREQVREETAAAIRAGDVVANGESGQKLNELHPQWYAKSRTDDAIRHAASASATARP